MVVTSHLDVVCLMITGLTHWSPGLFKRDILGNETNWRQVPENIQGELVICTCEN